MDNRQTQTDVNLSSLPEDLQLEIIQLIRKREFIDLYPLQVNRHFYKITHTNTFWITQYERDFGPLTLIEPDQADKHSEARKEAKNQYIAAYFYHATQTALRKDQVLLSYKKLQQFLCDHAEKPWAQYYLGMLKFNTPINTRTHMEGFALLKQSFDSGDYRAAPVLAKICLFPPSTRNRYVFDQITLDALIPTLAKLSNKGIKNPHHALLHINQIGCAALKQDAKQWLLDAMCEKHAGTTVLFYLYNELNIPISTATLAWRLENPETAITADKKSILSVITDLETLITQQQNQTVKGHLQYQLARLHFRLDKKQQALTALQAASDANIADAHFWLSEHYYRLSTTTTDRDEQDLHKQKGDEYLDKAFTLHHSQATHLIAQALQKNTLEKLASAFLAGNLHAIQHLAKLYILSNVNHSVATDAEKIWWLQTAALCGHQASFNLLKKIAVDHRGCYPYVHCALGIIYHIGLLLHGNHCDHSTIEQITNSRGLSLIQFEALSDQAAIKDYLEAGKKTRLLCAEIERLLSAEIARFKDAPEQRNSLNPN